VAYDPWADGVLADPYPWYRWLRTEAPCHHVAERDLWVVSRYDDVVAALRNHQVFSSNQGIDYERRRRRDLVQVDPPEHTRLRRLVSRDFVPRAIAALEPRVEALVDGLLDVVLEKQSAELVADLAEPLPVTVIAELLGVPVERRADFKRWSSDLIEAAGGQLGPAEATRTAASRKEFASFLREAVADRRHGAAPGATDIITSLVYATDADALSELELIEFCIVLLVAGNETTTNAIGNGALAMLAFPDQWRAVARDPSLVTSFVEEVLRFDAPIQGFFRNTLAPVEVAGSTIEADAKVLVLFASANRDPAHFPDPDTFLASRNPVDHVAFGNGIHHCLGAPLARLELGVLARAFIRRVKWILPAGEPRRTRNPLFRGVRTLPVVVAAR
jgi:cytochrome P450